MQELIRVSQEGEHPNFNMFIEVINAVPYTIVDAIVDVLKAGATNKLFVKYSPSEEFQEVYFNEELHNELVKTLGGNNVNSI